MDTQKVRIDDIDWYIGNASIRSVQPLCPQHNLRMRAPMGWSSHFIECADCKNSHHLPRPYSEEVTYVLDRIDSKVFKGMKVLNLDDEAIPIAEAKATSKNGKYFATAILTESKVGQRLVVYAGERGKSEKTQIFVEPEIKRLAFDQKDIHPSEVFVKLEGVFKDGTKISIEKTD